MTSKITPETFLEGVKSQNPI